MAHIAIAGAYFFMFRYLVATNSILITTSFVKRCPRMLQRTSIDNDFLMMMMMMINFINVSRPHSLGKSHTNLGTQLIDIKNM